MKRVVELGCICKIICQLPTSVTILSGLDNYGKGPLSPGEQPKTWRGTLNGEHVTIKKIDGSSWMKGGERALIVSEKSTHETR